MRVRSPPRPFSSLTESSQESFPAGIRVRIGFAVRPSMWHTKHVLHVAATNLLSRLHGQAKAERKRK